MNRRHATHPLSKHRAITAVLCGCLLSACSEAQEQNAVEQGRQLFESKALSQSGLNDYSCATCHDTVPGTPPSKKSGGALSGVTLRTRFWGGQEADLLGSVNACRNYFMG